MDQWATFLVLLNGITNAAWLFNWGSVTEANISPSRHSMLVLCSTCHSWAIALRCWKTYFSGLQQWLSESASLTESTISLSHHLLMGNTCARTKPKLQTSQQEMRDWNSCRVSWVSKLNDNIRTGRKFCPLYAGSYRKSSQGIDTWLFLGHLCSVGVEFSSWLGTRNYSRAIPGQWRWSIRLSQRVVLDWLTTGSYCWGLPSGWLVVGSLAWWWRHREFYTLCPERICDSYSHTKCITLFLYYHFICSLILSHIWVRSLISCCEVL